MPTYQESIGAIKGARDQKNKTGDQLYRLNIERRELLNAISQAERDFPSDHELQQRRGQSINPAAGLKEQLQENEQKRVETEALLGRQKDSLSSQIDSLFKLGPENLIESWNDDIPIILMPLRVETRFETLGASTQLWVRVFPDDIAIASHEKTLTTTEGDFGQNYWKVLWDAKDDEGKKKSAWKQIADKFGANRAAWVVLQTKPLNWTTMAASAASKELQFQKQDLVKPESWSEAPHTKILPDKLVLMAFRNGHDGPVIQQTGALIPDRLPVGPNPLDTSPGGSISRDANGSLVYQDDLKWIAEFETAVHAGMGFIIPLSTADAAQGFDQLVLIGLKYSCDEHSGKALLEELIDSHHYSPDGFTILPQGAATNNTDVKQSGYTSRDPLKEQSFITETGKPLFIPSNDTTQATEGQRLAEMLGIEYDTLQYIAGADITDNREAVAMNQALYAGTAGYHFENMLGFISKTELPYLRKHFTNYVTGRGPLPAIMVGKQPYGIIITSQFDKLKFPTPSPLHNRRAFFDGQGIFIEKLYNILAYLQKQWEEKLSTVACLSQAGDPHDHFLQILGLQPGSASFFQRTAYSMDTLTNHGELSEALKFLRDLELHTIEIANTWKILEDIGYVKRNPDGSFKPIPLLFQMVFQHFPNALDGGNLVDPLPLSEQNRVSPYDTVLNKNYFDWLLSAKEHTGMEKEDFGGNPIPSSLLFLMLRYSMLHETNTSIGKILATNGITSEELQQSRTFLNLSKTPDLTHWEVFSTPIQAILPNKDSKLSFYAYAHAGLLANQFETQNLEDFKAAVSVLKELPTARLERAFTGHLDSLIYRLDAWQTSLFDIKLQNKRNISAGRPLRNKGIYIGAYGYLENVKPEPQRKIPIPADSLPKSLGVPMNSRVFTDPGNGGYFQTPSLNHASAAAMLRNGYLTYSDSTQPDLMSVNLSSERVRRALFILEGIRNGQRLEALLGYQFERGFHDAFSEEGINLNPYIPLFRKAYPIRTIRIPNAGTKDAQETVDDFTVVNGSDLSNRDLIFPYNIPELNTLPKIETDRIKLEKNKLENSMDALQDLLTSESFYQLSLGNFDRASAVMQAVGNSHINPEIEGVESLKGTDQLFTHRVTVHLDASQAGNPWSPIAMTPRALMEPALNNWLATIIGDPTKINCVVEVVDADGTTKDPSTLSVSHISLQPIDLVYLTPDSPQNGASELEMRLRKAYCLIHGTPDEAQIKISFANNGGNANPTVKSFTEIWPLVTYIKKLCGTSRSLNGRDFDSASNGMKPDNDNPGKIDASEFKGRITDLYTQTSQLVTDLQNAVAIMGSLKTSLATEDVRKTLIKIANSGISDSFPGSTAGSAQAGVDSLTAQAKLVATKWAALLEAHNKRMAGINDPSTGMEAVISGLIESGKAVLGKDFLFLPLFGFNDVTGMDTCYQSRGQILAYARGKGKRFAAEEWLHGISLVRERMHTLEMIRLLNESFNEDALMPEPMQIPFRSGDNWLGVDFPTGTAVYHDTISIVALLPETFDVTKPQAGFLIDEWTENIPLREGTTGIGFHFDQPSSMPPQALLLAVSPTESGNWTWDGITGTVLDTIKRAKLRAIEPDQLNQTGLTTLLPAVWAEFSTSGVNLSLDYSRNIKGMSDRIDALSLKTLKMTKS